LRDEFFRMYTTAYGFGKLDGDEEVRKELYRQGKKPAERVPGALFTPAEIARLRKEAFVAAGEFADEIMAKVRDTIRGFVGPDGRLAASREELGTKIAEVFDGFLDQESTTFFAEGHRAMKIRDRAAWLEWQKTKQPHTKWMKAQLKERAKTAKPLTKAQRSTKCATGYSKWYNRGQYVGGMEDKNVVAFLFSNMLEPPTPVCGLCLSLNGMVLKKGDRRWGRYVPPLHWKCRCRLVRITEGEDFTLSGPEKMKDMEPQIGFGGSAKSVLTQRDVAERLVKENLAPI
jgi:hypothetical protein